MLSASCGLWRALSTEPAADAPSPFSSCAFAASNLLLRSARAAASASCAAPSFELAAPALRLTGADAVPSFAPEHIVDVAWPFPAPWSWDCSSHREVVFAVFSAVFVGADDCAHSPSAIRQRQIATLPSWIRMISSRSTNRSTPFRICSANLLVIYTVFCGVCVARNYVGSWPRHSLAER